MTFKERQKFVNATSMDSCFGMLTFYICFCYYQIKQYDSYQPCDAVLFKVESEVLLNFEIAMKKY